MPDQTIRHIIFSYHEINIQTNHETTSVYMNPRSNRLTYAEKSSVIQNAKANLNVKCRNIQVLLTGKLAPSGSGEENKSPSNFIYSDYIEGEPTDN